MLSAVSGGIIAIIFIMIIIILVFLMLLFITRYKKCPSDKIMVIYGKLAPNKDGTPRFAQCIHGGATLIVPLIQDYAFLDLNPISFTIELKRIFGKSGSRFDFLGRFNVAISTDPKVMNNAAERLLGLSKEEISQLAQDIICGQIRLTAAHFDSEDFQSREGNDKFLAELDSNIENQISKFGLRLYNTNIQDIKEVA